MPALPSAAFQRHRLSVDDYYRMAAAGILGEDDRVELIDGEIIDMAPIGPDHAFGVKSLNRLFARSVGNRAIVSVQDPIRLDPHNEPQPDLALLRYRDDLYRGAHPGPADVLLIVEVAHSSLPYDQDIKLPLYARFAIPEVWILDIGNRQLEIHRKPSGGVYRETLRPSSSDTVAPMALPDCLVDVHALI